MCGKMHMKTEIYFYILTFTKIIMILVEIMIKITVTNVYAIVIIKIEDSKLWYSRKKKNVLERKQKKMHYASGKGLFHMTDLPELSG